MSRLRMNILVDAVAFAAMLLLVATGILMRYVLPPGSGRFLALWGMDRHGWGDIHFWIAVTLVTTVALHVVLHWSWVVGVVKGRSPERSVLRITVTLVGLLLLLGAAISPFLAPPTEQMGEPPHKQRTGERSREDRAVEPSHGSRVSEEQSRPTFQIDGTKTLGEVERSTGVPASIILKELGLPPDLPTDERLGRLRKRYDFQVHDIRVIVEKHREKEPR
jgi:hypothetical protein